MCYSFPSVANKCLTNERILLMEETNELIYIYSDTGNCFMNNPYLATLAVLCLIIVPGWGFAISYNVFRISIIKTFSLKKGTTVSLHFISNR